MATRFGAASPTHTYQAKMRWMVGGLVAAIVILVITLIFVVKNPGTPPPDTQAAPAVDRPAVVQPVASTNIPILFASQRIEEGTRLESYMFVRQELPADRLPEGSIKATEEPEILGRFAKQMITANLPILRDYISEVKPISVLSIPPGYRAVTITVDSRSGVEGFAKPNSRVDILWTYTNRGGQRAVATIVRFVKILSVGGVTDSQGKVAVSANQTTVTLLVSEKDAKKVELARNLGSLSLTLVGDTEPQIVQGETGVDSVDMSSLIAEQPTEVKEEEPSPGVMYMTDPKTGKQVRYVLKKGRWKREDGGEQ